ncbi:MAG: ATP-grasp domain-containing protein [Bacteroidales bacterium]|nr:ATP-grasp domain-containing protein [Bacteroidales bacterium]
MEKVVILINAISVAAAEDELDVLDQACVVEKALEDLGYETVRLFTGINLAETSEKLLKIKPLFVFNLVESLDGDGKLIHLAPALLEHLKIPYAGCPAESIYVTGNKTLSKRIMIAEGLPAPELWDFSKKQSSDPSALYIAKPVMEDASVGIEDENILPADQEKIREFQKAHPEISYFFERYIPGREFNISVLGGDKGPEVLPIPEIIFEEYPYDKPRIIGYQAKWDEDSFEYKHTNRVFGLETKEPQLAEKLRKICVDCWNLFGLKGFARVDLRVDESGNPWILEVNANPCLSEDAGFYAATSEAGYSFTEVMKRIIEDV